MEHVLILSFIGMALIGGPVAYALALSVWLVLVAYLDLPQVLIVNNIFPGIDSFSFMAVPFFMLAVAFMSAGGMIKRLVGVMQAMVGSFTGGLAQAVAVAGMFFAAISGSSAATTAAIGSTMVDEMERKGYRRKLAAGIVAAAGTLSLIHLLKTIKEAFWAMMTPVIIIGGIYGGIFTPTEAMAVAAVYSIVIGLFVHKELKLSDFPEIVFKAVIGTILVMLLRIMNVMLLVLSHGNLPPI